MLEILVAQCQFC